MRACRRHCPGLPPDARRVEDNDRNCLAHAGGPGDDFTCTTYPTEIAAYPSCDGSPQFLAVVSEWDFFYYAKAVP